MKTLIYWIAVLLAMWCMTSCGPNYYLKRSEANLRKAILKGAKVQTDTLYVRDT